MKYTLDLISSHSWYFMELSPSTVALTFSLWPLNIYQLLNWLCTIIPSSISQIHHVDHSSQFQVRGAVPIDAVIFTRKRNKIMLLAPQWALQLKALVLRTYLWRRGVGYQSLVMLTSVTSRSRAVGLPATLLALVNPGPLWACFRTNFISQSWKVYFGKCFHSFVYMKSTFLRCDLASVFF